MTVVAIHQPNYAPWLGYFHKIAAADVFVFLDDVQYTKNSYINRVKVLLPGGAKWLTVPVTVSLGQTIAEVRPARADWPARHLDTLRQAYRKAPAFAEVWPVVEALWIDAPADGGLAAINMHLVQGLAGALGLSCDFRRSSAIDHAPAASDDRLIALVGAIDPAGTYLSGKGAAAYQDPEKFAQAGLGFRYSTFQPAVYDQGTEGDFTAGLSVLDAAFRLGWARTRDLIAQVAR